jgi:hypothetical protein
MSEPKGDARVWGVYVSPKGIRVTRRIIPPAELRKDELCLAEYPADLSWNDARALAQVKFGKGAK